MTLMKAMDNRQHKLRYVIVLLIMLIAPIQAVNVYPVNRANIIPLYSAQDSRVEGLVDVTEIKLVGRKLFNANDSITDLANTLSTTSSSTLVPDTFIPTTTVTPSQVDPSVDSTRTTPTYDSTTDTTSTTEGNPETTSTTDRSTDTTSTYDSSTEKISTTDRNQETTSTADSSTDTLKRFSTSSGRNLGEYQTSGSEYTTQSTFNTLTTSTNTDLNLLTTRSSSSETSQTSIETKESSQPTALTQSTTSTQSTESTLLPTETSFSTASTNTDVTSLDVNGATSITKLTSSLEKTSSDLQLATTTTGSTSSVSTITSGPHPYELQGTSSTDESTKSSSTDTSLMSSEVSSSKRPDTSKSSGGTTVTTHSEVSVITTSSTGAALDKSSLTDITVYSTTESSYTQSSSLATSTYLLSFASETSTTKTSGTEASSDNLDTSTVISVSVTFTSQAFSATETFTETQQDTSSFSSSNTPNIISVNGATTITLSSSHTKYSEQIFPSYSNSAGNGKTQGSISTTTQTDSSNGNSAFSKQTGYTTFNTLTSQSASPTAFVPTNTLETVNSKSYTSNWLPTIIVTEVSLSTGSRATNTKTTASLSSVDLPEAIFPVSTVTTTTGYTFINIGFKKDFNYMFLVSSYVSTAQIFEYLPDLLQYPFLNNKNQKRELTNAFANVQVMDIMPDYGYTSEYITAVAKVYFPEAYVAKLQHFISDKNSVFYKSPESRLNQLAALINPDIEIASSSTYSGSAQTLTAKYTITSDGVPLTFTTVYQSYAPISATATHIHSTAGFYNSDGSLNNFQEPRIMNKKEREKAIVYFVFMSLGFLIVSVVLFFLIKTVNNIPKVNIRLKHDLEKGTLTPQRLSFIPFLFPDYSASQIESIGTHSSQSQSNSDSNGSVAYDEKMFFPSCSTGSLTDDPTPGSIITEGTIRYYVDFDGNYFYAGESTTSATSSNTSLSSEQVSASINSSNQLSTEQVSLLDNDSINPDDIILDENGDVLIDVDDDPILTNHSGSGSNSKGNVYANQNNELTTTQLKALLKNSFSSRESSNHKDLQQLINFDDSGPTTDELIRNNILQDAELHDFLYSANGSDSYNNSSKLATRDTQGDFSSASGTNYFSERNGGRSSDVSDVHVGEIDTLDAEIYLRIKPIYEKPLPTLLRQQTHSKSAHDSPNSSATP